MSSLWIEEFPTFDEDLGQLSRQQLHSLSVKCLTHAYGTVRFELSCRIGPEKLSAVDELIRVVVGWNGNPPQREVVLQHRNALGLMVPDDAQAERSIPGWYKTLTALLHCVTMFASSVPHKHAACTMASAYGAVADADLQGEIWRAKGLIGDQIAAAERRSAVGMAEIAFQRECLAELCRPPGK